MAQISLTQVQLDSLISAINARVKAGVSYTKAEGDALYATPASVNALFTPAVLTALVP